jgi:hypothetical protein
LIRQEHGILFFKILFGQRPSAALRMGRLGQFDFNFYFLKAIISMAQED